MLAVVLVLAVALLVTAWVFSAQDDSVHDEGLSIRRPRDVAVFALVAVGLAAGLALLLGHRLTFGNLVG